MMVSKVLILVLCPEEGGPSGLQDAETVTELSPLREQRRLIAQRRLEWRETSCPRCHCVVGVLNPG